MIYAVKEGHASSGSKKLTPAQAGVSYPVCVGGKQACPSEDCGGVWGYEGFLSAIRNPHHPEQEEMLGDGRLFDLEGTIKATLRCSSSHSSPMARVCAGSRSHPALSWAKFSSSTLSSGTEILKLV